jgi:hypothetical protein
MARNCSTPRIDANSLEMLVRYDCKHICQGQEIENPWFVHQGTGLENRTFCNVLRISDYIPSSDARSL